MSSQAFSVASHGKSPSSVVADANVSLCGVTFTQLILNALHGHENVKAQSRSTDNDVREKQAHLTEEDLYSLPFNAAELLDQFFSLRHTLSPVFHVPTVRPLFDMALRCRPEERHQHKSTFILLNMIFALCTSHWLIVSEDTVANHRAARRYYDIAMMLIQPNLLRDWSLGHVQALLIGVRYLQGSSCAAECWNILGLAIRIAYGLRLHRDPPDTDPPPLRETKRRVWFAAYTLDGLLSMIYERPSSIRSAECSILLPEDLDDACIRSDGLLYPMPRRPSAMIFSIEVIKLYRIMETLMTQLTGNIDNGREDCRAGHLSRRNILQMASRVAGVSGPRPQRPPGAAVDPGSAGKHGPDPDPPAVARGDAAWPVHAPAYGRPTPSSAKLCNTVATSA